MLDIKKMYFKQNFKGKGFKNQTVLRKIAKEE